MIIERIEDINSKKKKVTFDNGSFWPLYSTEVKKYKLCEGMEADFEELYKEVVLRRARLRAMKLLESQDRTKKQLTAKLKSDGYDDMTIEDTFDYLDKFHYVDDERLSENFVDYHRESMSSQAIKRKLMEKGVDRDTIDSVLAAGGNNDEEVLKKLIESKSALNNISDEKQYRKAVNFLMRRGFGYELIRKYLHFDDGNDSFT